MPGPSPTTPPKKSKPPFWKGVRGLFRDGWQATPFHGRLIGLWLVGVAATVLGLAYPLATQQLIDRAVLVRTPGVVLRVLLAVGGVAVVQLALSVARSWWRQLVARDLEVRLQRQVFRHVLRLPVADVASRAAGADAESEGFTPFFGTGKGGESRGSLTWRILRDAHAPVGMVTQHVSGLAGAAVTFAGGLVVLFHWDPLLAGVVVLGSPVYVVLMSLGADKLRPAWREVVAKWAGLAEWVEDRLRGLPQVKLARAETREADRHADRGQDLVQAQMRIQRRLIGFNIRDAAAVRVAGLLLFGLLVWRTTEGELSPGQLVGGLTYLAVLRGPLDALVQFRRSIQNDLAARDRTRELLDAPPEEPDAGALPPEGPWTLRADGVHFAYREGRPVLRGLDLTLAPGSMVGLAGPTGVGKTTLAMLLCGLQAPQEGRVLLNDRPLIEYAVRPFRARLGAVMQREHLFTGTVRDNVVFAAEDPDADPQPLIDALGVGDVIATFPAGLDTPVGDSGTHLSGGQRQVIGLLRALMVRPRLLVLDEATTGLDESRERAVLSAARALVLDGFGEGVPGSVLMISHRRSALSLCDRVEELDFPAMIHD